jgi:fructosamine-3-kinase
MSPVVETGTRGREDGAAGKTESLRERLASLLSSPVSQATPLGGGSIASAYRVRLADGRRLFVKRYAIQDEVGATDGDGPGRPAGTSARIVACEARGLAWLAETGAIPVAQVVAVDDTLPILVLEWIEPGGPRPGFAEELGRGLAALHAVGAARFGFDEANFIGPLAQSNRSEQTWPVFYAEQRLRPLLRMAHDRGALDPATARATESLLDGLESRCGPPEPPARLHGDLWRGNLMTDASGQPVLIDPAVYAGHREMDLAMMRLFGGFEARVFDAYAEAFPLAPGAPERVALHQLYPLLVHVVLFGGGYAAEFAAALRLCR